MEVGASACVACTIGQYSNHALVVQTVQTAWLGHRRKAHHARGGVTAGGEISVAMHVSKDIGSGMTLASCQAAVTADDECSQVMYSNDDACVCVKIWSHM